MPVSTSTSPSSVSASRQWQTMRARWKMLPVPFTRRRPTGHMVPVLRWWMRMHSLFARSGALLAISKAIGKILISDIIPRI
jgi:hypothetical protein